VEWQAQRRICWNNYAMKDPVLRLVDRSFVSAGKELTTHPLFTLIPSGMWVASAAEDPLEHWSIASFDGSFVPSGLRASSPLRILVTFLLSELSAITTHA
jgi:hypothetical protein